MKCIFLPPAALDWGGPRREWFELICKTLFDTSNHLFTRFSDNNQGLVILSFFFLFFFLSLSSIKKKKQLLLPFGKSLIAVFQVHPNAERPAHLRLKMYEFAGRIVGKCLYESALGGAYKQLVRARFTRSFLAQIIGLRMNYKVWNPAPAVLGLFTPCR